MAWRFSYRQLMVNESSVSFSRLNLNSTTRCWLRFQVWAAAGNHACSSSCQMHYNRQNEFGRAGRKMAQTKSPFPNHDPAPVVSLPYALYDSLGLLFELYQGGQPNITKSNG